MPQYFGQSNLSVLDIIFIQGLLRSFHQFGCFRTGHATGRMLPIFFYMLYVILTDYILSSFTISSFLVRYVLTQHVPVLQHRPCN
jgi:hypothetical protein